MDDKKDSCQNCGRPVGKNPKVENGKAFCGMGCLRKYREAKYAG